MKPDYSSREYEIMEYIHNRHGCQYLDVINYFDPINHCNETKELLSHLISRKAVEVSPQVFRPDISFVSLTPQGVSALTIYHEQKLAEEKHAAEVRREAAEKEAQQRLENKIAIAQVLVPAVTFVLGLLVEHFSGIIGLLSDLFG